MGEDCIFQILLGVRHIVSERDMCDVFKTKTKTKINLLLNRPNNNNIYQAGGINLFRVLFLAMLKKTCT